MLELIRRRQKEEIMSLLKDEELRERERLEILNDPQITPEERAGLQGRFNMERRQAQSRIEKLIVVHERQVQEYKSGASQ